MKASKAAHRLPLGTGGTRSLVTGLADNVVILGVLLGSPATARDQAHVWILALYNPQVSRLLGPKRVGCCSAKSGVAGEQVHPTIGEFSPPLPPNKHTIRCAKSDGFAALTSTQRAHARLYAGSANLVLGTHAGQRHGLLAARHRPEHLHLTRADRCDL
jgi:hypothetical protein